MKSSVSFLPFDAWEEYNGEKLRASIVAMRTALKGLKGNAARSTGKASARWSRWLNRHATKAVFLIIAVIFAYYPAWHAGFIWDDDYYVTKDVLLTARDGLWRIWFTMDAPSQYFPLVYTTFRLERALWGLNPVGYHWVNILFQCANALLLWRVLILLEIPGGFLAAAIFALHPVQVETVAWVTELKNLEMGFFYLVSLLAWMRFARNEKKGASGYYLLALVTYTLALCAKTTACTFPAALLLIDWLRGRRIGWRRLIEVAPFVALGFGMGVVTIFWERYHQGTEGALFTISGRKTIRRPSLMRERKLVPHLGSLKRSVLG